MKKEDIIKYNRHLNIIDYINPFSIGNGDFCATLDATSTQTLIDYYKDIPLTTISNKLWFKKEINGEVKKTFIDGKGYMLDKTNQEELFNLKRQYPHKYNLFSYKLVYKGETLNPKYITEVSQDLDLYYGIVSSTFKYKNEMIRVKSLIYQDNDELQIEIDSSDNFKLIVEFLYPSFNKEGYIKEKLTQIIMDNNIINIVYDDLNTASLYLNSNENYILKDNILIFDASSLKLNIGLNKLGGSKLLDDFWKKDNGIIIDNELLVERMILSKYLLKLNSTGIYPPSEAGLTYNNWNSKFHLEMHLIHSLWLIYDNHLDLLLKSFDYYLSIYETSKLRAQENDYKGIRFPKMTSPDGLDSPSNIGPLLVWQEPHIVFMLQEIYRIYKREDLLFKYESLIKGVIDFIISYLTINENSIEMLEPLLECCESIEVKKCHNPMFEVEYFRHVLSNQKEIDLILYGKERYNYDFYVNNLIRPKISNNIYLKTHDMLNEMDMYPDHPTETFSYSFFKSRIINKDVMKSTLDYVINNLDLSSYWGWDFPLMGMTAINLGYIELGIKICTMDALNNDYLYNGHNTSNRNDLKIYLPGNGAFLLFYKLLSKELNK